jgi:hypothetical protein
VQAPAGRAYALGEHALNGHVNVLIARHVKLKRARFALRRNLAQARHNGVYILGRKHALPAQHGGVGNASRYVLAP